MKVFFLIIIWIVLYGCSCRKEEVTYSKTQMYMMAKEIDPNVELVLGRSITDTIPCSDYGAGCLSVHRIKVRKVVMVAVEFQNRDKALTAGKRIYAYHYNNWLFDDVVGEPILEKFVKRVFNAKLIGKPLENNDNTLKNQ